MYISYISIVISVSTYKLMLGLFQDKFFDVRWDSKRLFKSSMQAAATGMCVCMYVCTYVQDSNAFSSLLCMPLLRVCMSVCTYVCNMEK